MGPRSSSGVHIAPIQSRWERGHCVLWNGRQLDFRDIIIMKTVCAYFPPIMTPCVVKGLNRNTLSVIQMACHTWSLLIFSAMHLRGEEKLWSCSLSKSTWTLDHKVRSMYAKLSSRQVCLCAWESQALLASWSRARLLYFPHTLCASLCVPVAVRWSGVKKGQRSRVGGGERVGQKDGGKRELAVGRFHSVSLAVSPQRWNARSLLRSLFWEVSFRAGAVLNWLDYYQMVESAPAVWQRSIKGVRQGGRETGNYSAEQPNRSCQAQGSVETFITSNWNHWNLLPSLTSQFCWKHGVNKQDHKNALIGRTCYIGICFDSQ